MSNRRSEIWKLLYNLVKNNQSDSVDVFVFVEDIICKEPSLIRPFSLQEYNNKFQDTFIFWLISNLNNFLNDCNTNEE